MRRLREIKQLASGHTVTKWWHLEIVPDPSDFRAKILKHHSGDVTQFADLSSLRGLESQSWQHWVAHRPVLGHTISAITEVLTMPHIRQRSYYILLGELPRADRELQ